MSLRFLESSFTTNLNVFKSTTMDSEVKQFLLDLYQPLIGRMFEAKYNGEFNMPYTGKERTILQIKPENPFAAEMGSISNCLLYTSPSPRDA